MSYQTINKKNIPKWISTLKYLVNIFNTNDIKYFISYSGLEYILGSNIYPYDIDLFMSKENVKKLYKILKKYTVSNLHYWEEDNREYLEFQAIYNDIPFEICEWKEEPKELKTIKFEDIEITTIKA